MDAPLWARQVHNLLLLHENARDEREARAMADAVCAAMRRHIREQYGLADKYSCRRRQAVGSAGIGQ